MTEKYVYYAYYNLYFMYISFKVASDGAIKW